MHAHTNRLSRESSPYLLQHAHNPVDWHAWNGEALARAKAEDRPIFLSVGYSTCYWCHVMERQCFESEAVAAVMNRLFVNIKVDREERPDVDSLYMNAVQILTRHGGWPMSVWLTPDGRPFYAGTYFPPADAHGRPGFITVMVALDDAWHNRRDDVERSANELTEALSQLAHPPVATKPFTFDEALIGKLLSKSTAGYDRHHGGFGSAPKFPRETLLELILATPRSRDAATERALHHTLLAMSHGGMRDHLSGAFHRYSTDERWLVPHFEIMLYDQAMLAFCYAEASLQFNEPAFLDVARGICDFVLREMTDGGGAFYTAFDAEVDGREGENYLWTAELVKSELVHASFSVADSELFNHVYGLAAGPNFADPHHGDGTPTANVLFIADAEAGERNRDLLGRMRHQLKQARDRRAQPRLDTKIITSWNALMIRALARTGAIASEARYISAAARAADWLRDHHDVAGVLRRTSRDGQTGGAAFLDDYAFFGQALLELQSVTGEKPWRDRAAAMADRFHADFSNPNGGGLFFSRADATDLPVRQTTASDSPLPSGNAVAADVLMDLGRFDDARAILVAFAETTRTQAEMSNSMLQATAKWVALRGPLSIEPAVQASRTSKALRPTLPVAMIASWVDPLAVRVVITIEPDFHLQQETTRLIVDPADAAIESPPPIEKRYPYADQPLAVYEGTMSYVVRFRSPPTEAISLQLAYQACTESACLAPTTVTIEVPVLASSK